MPTTEKEARNYNETTKSQAMLPQMHHIKMWIKLL
jgi:hypothetical protein